MDPNLAFTAVYQRMHYITHGVYKQLRFRDNGCINNICKTLAQDVTIITLLEGMTFSLFQ